MKLQRKKVATALALLLGVGAVTLLTTTYAQAQQTDIKVDVTGSNIKRVEGESALPVTVLTRKDIQESGATSAMELLQMVSANNSSGNVSLGNVIGATTFSNQTASLRGLSGTRTLVLINGKRMTSSAGAVSGAEGVNLTSVPFAAIERVEILKDGASAIYGSDAIGGVINFITRQDYRGADGFVQYGAPTRSGGGEQYMANGSVGFGDLSKDRYNAFFSLAYQEQKPLDQRDRDFSETSYLPYIGLYGISGNTFPAYITTGGIGSPTYPNCPSPNVGGPSQVDFLGSRCYYDPSQTAGVEMIPDSKLWNFFGSARFQINRDWQAYLTGAYSRDETRFIIQPTPISSALLYGPDGTTPATILIPPTSPFYPHDLAAAHGVDGQPLNVNYRAVAFGNRDTTDINENGQIIAGIKGAWKNWDWDGNFNYGESKTSERNNNGFVRYSQVLPLLNSGVINVFGPNTPEELALVDATQFREKTFDATAKNYGFQGKTSGEIWKLPAGPMYLALGGEVRREELKQNFNPALNTGDITGYGGNFLNIDASRNVWAAYTEVNVPITKTLEGDVAVRYDHYSDFGGSTNPKVSLRWQPVSTFLVRGSYGTGFLAPSLYQLYTPQTSGLSSTGVSDPLRCPPAVPIDQTQQQDCLTQFGVTFGGNPNLKAEQSFQVSTGIVWEPIPGSSVSVDYFKLNLSDTVSNGAPISTILQDLNQYGNLVTRGPVDPTQPNLPGHIIKIQQTFTNLGNTHMEGLDIDLRYRTPVSSIGRFRLGVSGTYFIRYDSQQLDGSYLGGISNAYGAVATGIIPRWKSYQSVVWDKGPWSATLANTYQSDYTDYQCVVCDPDNPDTRRVSSMSLWDLQAQYSGFKNWTLTLGVKNVFDTNPPVSNQQNTFQPGFDPSYYDPRARFVYGSVAYSFR